MRPTAARGSSRLSAGLPSRALVKGFLSEVTSGESESDRLRREERALRERIATFRASDLLSRDELHSRST